MFKIVYVISLKFIYQQHKRLNSFFVFVFIYLFLRFGQFDYFLKKGKKNNFNWIKLNPKFCFSFDLYFVHEKQNINIKLKLS